MEEPKRDGDEDEEEAFDAEDTLVDGSDLDLEDDEGNANLRGKAGPRTSNRSTLWVILATISTLVGRRTLTTGFRTLF